MYSGVSYGTDPNVSRILEETIGIVTEVDQRLQSLKTGIVQAFPHLAPILQVREMSLRQNPFVLGSMPSAFGQIPAWGHAPTLGLGWPTTGWSPLLGAPSGFVPFAPSYAGVPNVAPYLGTVPPSIGAPTGFVPFAPSYAGGPNVAPYLGTVPPSIGAPGLPYVGGTFRPY